jgi:hypothetical protein
MVNILIVSKSRYTKKWFLFYFKLLILIFVFKNTNIRQNLVIIIFCYIILLNFS